MNRKSPNVEKLSLDPIVFALSIKREIQQTFSSPEEKYYKLFVFYTTQTQGWISRMDLMDISHQLDLESIVKALEPKN